MKKTLLLCGALILSLYGYNQERTYQEIKDSLLSTEDSVLYREMFDLHESSMEQYEEYLQREIFLNREEAQAAYRYLNGIRKQPRAFYQRTGVWIGLRERPQLTWNDTLAAVAEGKAIDMARHDYVGHDKHNVSHELYLIGYYGYDEDYADESCAMGYYDGLEVIDALITDEGVPSLGHRHHLLNRGPEVGIGMAEGYTCVIITSR